MQYVVCIAYDTNAYIGAGSGAMDGNNGFKAVNNRSNRTCAACLAMGHLTHYILFDAFNVLTLNYDQAVNSYLFLATSNRLAIVGGGPLYILL